MYILQLIINQELRIQWILIDLFLYNKLTKYIVEIDVGIIKFPIKSILNCIGL